VQHLVTQTLVMAPDVFTAHDVAVLAASFFKNGVRDRFVVYVFEIYIYMYVYIHIHICIYLYLYVYMYVYVYLYVCVHTAVEVAVLTAIFFKSGVRDSFVV